MQCSCFKQYNEQLGTNHRSVMPDKLHKFTVFHGRETAQHQCKQQLGKILKSLGCRCPYENHTTTRNHRDFA